MDWEENLENAESTYYLATTRRSAQSLSVRATCYLVRYGIDIQVPSMLKNGSFSWMLISRGPNRWDEAWQEQEVPPQDVDMES